jgi:hypothetical protein
MAQVSRLHMRARLFNLVVTNVPGPRRTLHLCGRPLVEVLPTVPLSPYHGLGIAVVSYVDRMVFAVTTDPRRIPDGMDFAADLEASLKGLLEAGKADQRQTQGRKGMA